MEIVIVFVLIFLFLMSIVALISTAIEHYRSKRPYIKRKKFFLMENAGSTLYDETKKITIEQHYCICCNWLIEV